MFPKAHLTLHSRMSGSSWVNTPSRLSGSLKSFLYTSVYSCYFFLIPPFLWDSYHFNPLLCPSLREILPCYLYRFDNCLMIHIHHYSVIQGGFTVLNVFCAQPINTSFPHLCKSWSFYHLHGFAFSRKSSWSGILQDVAFLMGFWHSVTLFKVPPWLLGLERSFFFSTSYYSLIRWVSLSIR